MYVARTTLADLQTARTAARQCPVFLFEQCLIITEDSTSSNTTNSAPDTTSVGNSFQANFGRVSFGSGSLVHRTANLRFDVKPQRPQRLQTDDGSHTLLFAGGRSPVTRRAVHIRRHGSHLGSVESDFGSTWPKLGWSAPPDPFRQSSYKFLQAVKVNRMAFVTLAPRPAARHAWLHELADIAAMQAQLQLALQNPRRFHFVCSVRRQAKTLSSTDMTSLCTNWRSDEANAFLSAHSSTTQLVHGDGDENGNVDRNAGSAFTLECLHASHWRYVNF
ncbi:hypothetical protein ECG_07509 [Echinococcus granulosus]|nr:hypothetical protein ECG_07509 [Echinococcus granulosus]